MAKMGKTAADAAIFGGSSVKKVPLHHKIDMFGSYCVLILIWVAILVNTTLSVAVYYTNIPKEMLVHGPIIVNYSFPITASEGRLICNPFYKTLVTNSTLFPSAFADEVLTTAKSDAFLALPEVANYVDGFENATNYNVTFFSLTPNKVCELIPPALEAGSCLAYSDINVNCLENVFETPDGVNLHWWKHLNTCNLLVIVYIVIFIPAIGLVCSLMYDPPPAGLKLVTSPLLCALCFYVTGIAGLIAIVVVTGESSKFLNQAALYADYSEYTYSAGDGYWCMSVASVASILFGILYTYLHCFTPKYPRHKARTIVRQRHFDHELRKLKTKYHIEETSN